MTDTMKFGIMMQNETTDRFSRGKILCNRICATRSVAIIRIYSLRAGDAV